MGKKSKEKTLDLYYLKEDKKNHKNDVSSKNIKKQKNRKSNSERKSQDTKDEKIDFNEEVFIGLKRVENLPSSHVPKKKSQKKAQKQANQHKEKKKQQRNQTIKGKNTYQNTDEIMIGDIYSKQNQEKQKKDHHGQKVSSTQEKKKIEKSPKKLTKQQELNKKKRKAVFKVVKWTSLVVIIAGGVIYTLMSPIFNIKQIQVVGNAKISEEEIISLSQIQLDQNMFQYHTKEIVSGIKENAYIESVKINRKFPDTIELMVTERKATYKIPLGNAMAYINNQGYILEITSKSENLPIIYGTTTMQEEMQVGSRLAIKDLEKLGDVLKIMESATSNEIEDLITSIDITDKDHYVLRLEKKKKTVYLGDISNLSTKMLWIITFNEEEENTEGDIILNMNLNNERPYFRKSV